MKMCHCGNLCFWSTMLLPAMAGLPLSTKKSGALRKAVGACMNYAKHVHDIQGVCVCGSG